jgi:beta-lactamase regulating signal transducer with metallopeptidase domain
MHFDLFFLADLFLKVSLLIGTAELAARVLGRRSAAARHLIWSFAISAALSLPIVATLVPVWNLEVLPAMTMDARGASSQSGPARPEGRANTERKPAPTTMGTTDRVGPTFRLGAAESSGRPDATFTPQSAIAAIWIAGALLVLARLAFGTARMWWIARRARPAAEAVWAPLAWRLAASLQLDGRVTFVSGGPDAMPMAWGLWRPRVLLPAEADSWPMSRQRVVLLHELAHVKRRDCLTQLLAQLACAGYWFNPLVWMAARRLRAEREHACDDLVLSAGTRGSDYADHLLDLARSLRTAPAPGWSAVAMAHRSQLEGRLMAILDPAVPRRSPTRAASLVCAILAAVCVVPLAALRPVAKAEAAVVTSTPDVVRDEEPPAASAVAPSTPSAAVQGRPSSPSRPAPTPTPTPTPTPSPTPRPTPNWQANAEVEIDADEIAEQAAQGAQAVVADGSHKKGDADPKVVAALMEALNDENKDVREQALHALSQMRTPMAAEVFVRLLKDTSPDVRQQAAFALGQTRDAKHVDALAGALKDSDADVREQAAFALGQLRDKRAVDPLIAALKDNIANVREQAAFALSQLRDPRAIDALIAALKDADPDVRQQAAFALGQIREHNE